MKILSHISIVCMLIISGASVTAQNQNGAPQGFNYQAIARDYNGQEMRNIDLMVRVSIYPGESAPVEWRELHSVTTNKFGLFTIIIGQGTHDGGTMGTFSDIQWGTTARFLEVELDFPNDAFGYLPTGKNQLFSVPYALYSNYAANGGTGGGFDGDTDPTNERQNFSQKNDTLLQLINNDGSVQSSVKNDFDPKNEIQDLQKIGNILKITNNAEANDIDLSPYLDNTDSQNLINKGDSIGISGGNTINLSRFKDNTDNQILINKGDSIGISGGNTINLSRFKDNTDMQQLMLETDSIRISSGNAVSIVDLRNPQSINFYAEKTTTSTVNLGIDSYLVFNETKLNNGAAYSTITGDFSVPLNGLYSFYITYDAKNSQGLKVFVNNGEYDYLVTAIGDGKIRSNFILYLLKGDKINIIVNSGGNSQIGKATWAGFKVY